MFAVAFEVLPSESGYQTYLDTAAALRPKLDLIDGFLSIERFKSTTHAGWILSLSFWRDEAALVRWRGDNAHHAAQAAGRETIFDDYRIRVVHLLDAPQEEPRPLLGLWEFPTADAMTPGRQYQSLTTPEKEIALFDFTDASQAIAWRKHAITHAMPPSRVLCGAVMRDYGLFERAQAPQVFPPVPRTDERKD